MRALAFKEPGGTEVLSLYEVPIGKPRAGEVLLKLTSVGLNRADLLFPQGRYFSKPAFPVRAKPCSGNKDAANVSRLGFEGAGIIVATGEGVDCRRGDRVAVISFESVSEQGCLAEYAIVAEKNLLPTPSSICDELAGAVWIQYLTAWGGLIVDGCLQKGQTLVITAASSSVGLAAIQVAKMCQARVVATTTSDAKIADLLQAGADLVLNPDCSDYVEAISDFTQGQGSDLVFDAVAGPATRQLVQGSKKGGKIIIQGMLDRRPMDIHAGVLMKRRLTVKGFTINSILESPEILRQTVAAITEGLNEKLLTPVIGGKYPLDDFGSAFELLKSNRHLGKIVINPGIGNSNHP